MSATPLRILVISNLYPPHFMGGYELRCQEVVEGLKARGHRVRVLTSTFGATSTGSDEEVCRGLRHTFPQRAANHRSWVQTALIVRNEWQNQRCVGRVLRDFRPDIVFLWNPKHISMSLVPATRAAGVPICFSVDDNWLARFTPDRDPWFRLLNRPARNGATRLAKHLLRSTFILLGLQGENVGDDYHDTLFVSHYLKNAALRAGKPVSDAQVVPGAVNAGLFPFKPKPAAPPTQLLYVGRLVLDKGVHTAVEALHILRSLYGYRNISLSVVGESGDSRYRARLEDFVRTHNLESAVHFVGSVPPEGMPAVYKDHDVLVFPSLVAEGLGRTLLEAMSAGLPVIGTATGGAVEVLRHGDNALIFPPGDALACATAVTRVLESPPLFEAIRLGGRRTVDERFSFEVMLSSTEAALMSAVREARMTRRA